MSEATELIAECKAHLAEIESDAERLEHADETQLRLAARRLELFVEHLKAMSARVGASEPEDDPASEPAPDSEPEAKPKRTRSRAAKSEE